MISATEAQRAQSILLFFLCVLAVVKCATVMFSVAILPIEDE